MTASQTEVRNPRDVTGLHQSVATAGISCEAPDEISTVVNIGKLKSKAKKLHQSMNVLKRLVYFVGGNVIVANEAISCL